MAKPFKKLWLCVVARPCCPDLPDQSHQLMMMQWCMPSCALIILLASGRVSAGSPSWSLTAGPLHKNRCFTEACTHPCWNTCMFTYKSSTTQHKLRFCLSWKGLDMWTNMETFLTFAHFFTWGIPVIQYVFSIDYPLEQESVRRNPTVPYSNWHGTNP